MRKSLAVFCNSTESSIVLLITNFIIFLETIRWDFLNVDTQLWDALNIGFKFPIFSWVYKVHFCRSISWTINPDSIAAVNLSCVNLEMYDNFPTQFPFECNCSSHRLNWRSDEILLNLHFLFQRMISFVLIFFINVPIPLILNNSSFIRTVKVCVIIWTLRITI